MRRPQPFVTTRRHALTGVVAVLALALPGAAAAAAAPGAIPSTAPGAVAASDLAVRADPAVQRAREELVRAHELLGDLTAELDAAAASYEHAQAHHLRLAEELGSASEALADVEEEVAAAEAAFAARVAGAYKRPDAGVVLSEAVLVAPDPGTALHRAALIERLNARDVRTERAEAARARTSELVAQHRVLDAGTAGAAAERRRSADDLAVAVGNARHRVESAREDVATAESDAVRRAEDRRDELRRAEDRRREQARRAAQLAALGVAGAVSAGGAAPPPAVDGKVCPVGAPNGFVDSWGFPRSGGRRHQGVDMFAAQGTPLYAVADGRVDRLTNNRLGGLSIHLVGDDGDRYYYAHLSAFSVSAGQRVAAGDVIGAVGNTGNARTTPPHLHWQYHPEGGAPVNPYPLALALCRV